MTALEGKQLAKMGAKVSHLVPSSIFFVLLFCCFFFVSVNAQCRNVLNYHGQCFDRNDPNDKEYENWCYQYASTSYNYSRMRPELILVAKGLDDVIAVVKYARANRVNIAVRSGGHQYSGASSTSANNIQLDLSQAFRGPKDFGVKRDPKTGKVTVRVGVSFRLAEFYAMMENASLFIPGGVCSNVHVGGHVQTGGYGVAIRAFGLFADHVVALELVTAEGKPKTVYRNSANKEDQDLYYAILGGSPGNLGVLTHVILEPHLDKDHPNSRGFHAIYNYTKEADRNILEMIPPMSDHPGDFDMMITILSGNKTFPLPISPTTTILYNLPPVIFVFAQWSNLGGPKQQFDDKAADWFKSIEAAFDNTKRILPGNPQDMDWKVPTPLSVMPLKWAFPGIREYAMPFVKRLYLSDFDSKKLQQRGWAKWATEQLDEFIVERNKDAQNPAGTIEMFSQIGHVGGKASALWRNGQLKDRWGRNLTAFSWRDQMTIITTFDAFYNNTARPDAQQFLNYWQAKTMDGAFGPHGTMSDSASKNAHKLLWETYGDRRMGNVWYQYYNKDIYNRLVSIKKAVDPSPVFTPNNFTVGVKAGEPDLPPSDGPKLLPDTAFPVTSELVDDSGLPAVDFHFTEWMFQHQWINSANSGGARRGGPPPLGPRRGGNGPPPSRGGRGNQSPKFG